MYIILHFIFFIPPSQYYLYLCIYIIVEGKGLTLEQVSAMYEQYHHRAQGKSSTKDSHTDNTTTITTTGEAFSTTTPMEKVQVSLSLEGTTVASPPASASASGDHNDGTAAPVAGVHPPPTSTTEGDKDDITNNVPTTPRESNRDAMIHNNEEATTTATTTTTDELLVSSSNFGMINTTNQTCDVMTIPGSSSSSSSTTIEDNATSLSIQQRDVTNDSNVKEEQTVEQTELEKEVAVAVPSSTSSSGEEEKESVANNDVLDVLIGHVHALFPLSFSKNVSDLEQLLNSHHHDQRKVLGGDVKVSKGDEFQLESSWGQEEEEEEEGAVMKALVLDPSFLVPGADSFYKLVNDAFLLAHAGRRACDGEKEPSTTVITGVEDGIDVDSMGHAFLSDKLPIARKGCDSSTRFWPSWMVLFSDGDGCGRPIPLDLLLLAGFDFSIESSYRRWLEKQNDGMTPAAVDAVATGTSSSANNDDLWQPFDNFTSSDCDLDLTREIARMYQVRTGLSSHNERILSLVPKDDLTEVQSIICSAEESMTFKIDHLLAAPLTWFTASSLKRGSRLGHEWNTLMKNILSKTKLHAEEFSSSVDEDTKQEDQVVVVVDDSNSNIEEPAVIEESTLPKKDSNKEGGSNSILPNNKDAVGSGNSAPPTTSKKGKKKKKKKVSYSVVPCHFTD